jgi:hypothetical protein
VVNVGKLNPQVIPVLIDKLGYILLLHAPAIGDCRVFAAHFTVFADIPIQRGSP